MEPTADEQIRLTEELVQKTSTKVGQEFFDTLVLELSRTLGVKYLFVGEMKIGRGERVATLALATDGMLVPGIEYDLAGTPCAHVVGQSVCFVEHSAAALYPADVLLAQMGVESYYGFPILDQNRAPLGLVVALHDQPLATNRWMRTLFQLFASRAGAEISRLQYERSREASFRFEALGSIAGGIAHDFNNILGSILANAELALEDAEGSVRAGLLDILSAGQRGQQVVSQIREFSQAGGRSHQAGVNLSTIVEEVGRTAGPLAGPSVRLVISIGAGTPGVRGAAAEISQVLLNLASNALQAAGDAGEVTISCRPATPADVLNACAAPDDAYAAVEVTDSGAGIPESVRHRIFEPFFTTRGSRGGSGLGLAIVQRIVKAHHGFVNVRSAVGEGSTFTVLLPA